MAAAAADPGAGEPGTRDPARTRQGGAARLHHRHRPLRLREPGQQRPVLPVHLPRRTRLRRAAHHRGDEGRLRVRDRRAREGGDLGRGGRGLPGRGNALRLGLPDSEAIRLAADPAHRTGRGEGGCRVGRGDAADRRHRGLPPVARQVHDAHRHVHAPGVHGRARRTQAHHLCRRRGRAHAACGADRARGRHGRADAGRPPGGRRAAHRARRAAPEAGQRLPDREPRGRPAVSPVLGGVPADEGARRHHAGDGQGGGAPLEHADRRAGGAARPRRRHAVRAGRPLRAAPGPRARRDRPAAATPTTTPR